MFLSLSLHILLSVFQTIGKILRVLCHPWLALSLFIWRSVMADFVKMVDAFHNSIFQFVPLATLNKSNFPLGLLESLKTLFTLKIKYTLHSSLHLTSLTNFKFFLGFGLGAIINLGNTTRILLEKLNPL